MSEAPSLQPDVTEPDLVALVLDDERFHRLSDAFDVFCPFEAMGAVRQELRHSNFLAYLLDPAKPHGFGDACLRAFLDAVLEEGSSAISRLHAHLADVAEVEIRREWRNIDLLLRLRNFSPELVIAVELKVESSEHGDQLDRYRESVAQIWPGAQHLFIFLTVAGDRPSSDLWTPVGYHQLLRFLEPIAESGAGHEDAKRLLAAYCAMIRRWYMTNPDLEEIARQLWSRHGQALDFLMEHRPDPTRELLYAIFDQRAKLVEAIREETGLEIVDDHCTNSYLRFGVSDWDKLPGMISDRGFTPSGRLVLLELEGYRGVFRAKIVLGRGDEGERKALYERLNSIPDSGLRTRERLSKTFHSLISRKLVHNPEADITFEQMRDGLLRQIIAVYTQKLPYIACAMDGEVGS